MLLGAGALGAVLGNGVVTSAGAIAMAAAAVLAIGVVFAPAPVAMLSVPGTVIFFRVAVAGVDLSVADLAAGVAMVAVLLRRSPRPPLLRQVLRLFVLYELAIVIVVLVNPTLASIVEVLHRGLIVAAPLIVGAFLAHHGKFATALRLFLFAGAILAAASVLDTLSSGFAPAFPLGMQKNPAGLFQAYGFVITTMLAGYLRLSRVSVVTMQVLFVIGVLATQSRSAMLALIVVMAASAIRGRGKRHAGRILLVAAACATFVFLSVSSELELAETDPSTARTRPIATRQSNYSETLAIWESSPVVGAGLRYFKTGESRTGEPHNLVLAALGESGILGLAALTVLVGGSARAVARGSSPLRTVALAVLALKVISSMFDIYWVAGTATLPWFVVGAACVPDLRGHGAKKDSQHRSRWAQPPAQWKPGAPRAVCDLPGKAGALS